MKVKDVMVATVATCRADTNLGAAVELMWNRNCGFLPIVNEQGNVTGVITDRDVCIALGTRNRLAGEVTAGEVSTGRLCTCKPEDDVRIALDTMAREHVRRLPVLTANGQPAGILSMDDLVLHAETAQRLKNPELPLEVVAASLQKLYQPQLPQIVRGQVAAA
jgi:CBS domain-containing protein